MNECVDLVNRAVPEMSASEVAEIVRVLQEKQRSKVRQGMTTTEAAKAAGQELSDQLKAAVKIERRNAAINRRIRIESTQHVMDVWADDPTEGILAMLYGSPKSRPGSRNSVHAAQSANFRRYFGGLEAELDSAGLMDVLRRGEMDLEVTRALWSIQDDRVLASLPSSAVQIARILHKYRELARLEANRAGAWIGEDIHYVVRQTHEPDRILRQGFDKWKEFILPKLDLDRMFPDEKPADLDIWLREAYANVTTGVRPRSSVEARAERMAAFKGPRNLARRVSQDRVFYFRSADDWYSYNQEFGSGSLREAYVNDLHRRAEATGMLQVLGTNPEYNLESIVRAVRLQLSRLDPKRLEAFDSKSRKGEKFENAIREVSGYTRTVASSQLANVGSFVRMWHSITMLGSAVLSSTTDIPIRATALRYQGQSFFGELSRGIIAPFKRLVAGTGTDEHRAIVHAAGYFNDIAVRNMVSRFSPDENIPGKIHRVMNTFFKWNLLGYWTDELRRASIESMAHFNGQLHESSWAQLSERTRRSFERFSISEKEWDLVRRGMIEDDDGRKFLTPEQIRKVDLSEFADYAGPRIDVINRGLLDRIKRRMKADERERGWADARHEKFKARLETANDRLIKLAERRAQRVINRKEILDGRIDEQVQRAEQRAGQAQEVRLSGVVDAALKMNQQLGSISTRLNEIVNWWKTEFDINELPNYSRAGLRRIGVEEATLQMKRKAARKQYRQEVANLKKEADEAAATAKSLRGELETEAKGEIEELEASMKEDIQAHYDTFQEIWDEKYAELQDFVKAMDERVKVRDAETTEDVQTHESRIQRILIDTRGEIADRLQRFYADEVDAAVITPDARATAFVRRGTQAGTVMGEVLRLFWQFKTFGIGIMQRGFMREFYGYDLGRGGRFGISELRGLALLLASTTAFGYIGMTLKDLVRGKKPRPVDDWRTARDAMAQGGSLGIYGDFLFGQQARYGAGFFSVLGGPTVGKLDDLTEIMGAVQSGQDPRARALKLAISTVPYNNLFYTRMAVDYLFLYDLQEAMNPGYLRRYEQRVEENTGSEFWLSPTEAAR